MFDGWWHVLPDDERPQWALEPFVAVGPLRFGMSPDDVVDAMAAVTAEVATPQRQWQAQAYPAFGVQLFHRDEELAGVVVDALCGPQVSVAGTALVGRVPSVLEQWLIDRAETRPPGTELTYVSAGVPASESLGVTINVQRDGDRLLTRPMFYPAEALDDLPQWLPGHVWAIHD
ncbi:hypothetical protein [Paractinoplanes maris]|uniref:hypothetical protein n=1 Tax=Paractinoplanes maris TaxID=1734446 RepID=UPI0020210C2F|nr:hypothetical protein [Actinoplanes maris]